MPGLIGPEEFGRVADAALELEGVDGVEVLFMHEWGGLTRFASSEIHQSTAQEDTGLRVRVVRGGRIGVAASNEFTQDGAARAAHSAKEMTEVVSPDPHWPGLAPKSPVPERSNGFHESTAATTPEQRAEAVAVLVGRCGDGFRAAGAYETSAVEVGVANTEGQRCWSPLSQATVTAVVTGEEGGSGYAEVHAGDAAQVDPVAIGNTAMETAAASRSPRPLDPGAYEVVLRPGAVETLVSFLAFLGFGGRSLAEGQSCFTGKEGEHVAAESISIYDDALSSETLGFPFDFEGVARGRTDLIKDGVFVGGVYDRRTARQMGRESTGHALPAPNPEGPFPLNLFMATGDATVEDMIAATERGVLVTRFHYSNVVHPIESTITGMTRDGTFLIENGEVSHPVQNFRFTQSIIEALKATSMVGRESQIASEFFFSASRVPALKIDRFQFTGRSDH